MTEPSDELYERIVFCYNGQEPEGVCKDAMQHGIRQAIDAATADRDKQIGYLMDCKEAAAGRDEAATKAIAEKDKRIAELEKDKDEWMETAEGLAEWKDDAERRFSEAHTESIKLQAEVERWKKHHNDELDEFTVISNRNINTATEEKDDWKQKYDQARNDHLLAIETLEGVATGYMVIDTFVKEQRNKYGETDQ